MNVTENPEQGARLERLMEALNITQTSRAQILGICQGYVSQLAGGSRNISRRVLHFIAKNYPDVNIHWLMTGDGNMFFEKKEEVAPVPGVLTGVMEAEAPVYERGHGGGVLEAALGRLASVEDRLSDALDRVSALEDRVRELEEGKEGKG